MKRPGQPDIRERFGSAVKAIREEKNLTQEELAYRAGIHRTYLSDVERGSRNVSLVILEKLAKSLELSLADLFARVSDS